MLIRERGQLSATVFVLGYLTVLQSLLNYAIVEISYGLFQDKPITF